MALKEKSKTNEKLEKDKKTNQRYRIRTKKRKFIQYVFTRNSNTKNK